MFFQELPGFSTFELYSSHSLPLLSHIPVERTEEVCERFIELRHCAFRQLRNSVDN